MRQLGRHAIIISILAAGATIGEAYLMSGNVAKAKEHLAQLDKICFFGCEEFTMLKTAIAEHEARK